MGITTYSHLTCHSPFLPAADQRRSCCYTEESATCIAVYQGKRPCHVAHATARVRRSSPDWRSSRSIFRCVSRSSSPPARSSRRATRSCASRSRMEPSGWARPRRSRRAVARPRRPRSPPCVGWRRSSRGRTPPHGVRSPRDSPPASSIRPRRALASRRRCLTRSPVAGASRSTSSSADVRQA